MVTQVAFIWEGPLLFTKLFEDCGHSCELVTPQLLAAPFFRRKLHGVIIPAGFASPDHCRILTALRAISPRIERFINEGGTLLAFGAGWNHPQAYDWLPVPVTYQYGFAQELLGSNGRHPYARIIEDGDETVSIDGTLNDVPNGEEHVILSAPQGPVLVQVPYGKGRIVITSLHEYPSRHFIRDLYTGGGEGLL
ncbi:hypothetical protein ACKUB1_06420 [Methanospirillum stamsii]|uniref:Glutamine amidotransferase domain-containing protein n=1 Tax=Methanospirillum stamsii TaxID=1277351 RepID=A0A2V2N321_9EURY|nr:hypothetical protein [Methanospirillum stamsii]PWR72940.1 hypothetical protein DLD82_11775 [Methanospirillum stamsii]